jgi:hypothetical protein
MSTRLTLIPMLPAFTITIASAFHGTESVVWHSVGPSGTCPKAWEKIFSPFCMSQRFQTPLEGAARRSPHSFCFYLREKARRGLYFVQRSRLTIFWFYHATTTRMTNVCMQGADLERWSQAPSLLVQNKRERFSSPPHNKFFPTKRQRS